MIPFFMDRMSPSFTTRAVPFLPLLTKDYRGSSPRTRSDFNRTGCYCRNISVLLRNIYHCPYGDSKRMAGNVERRLMKIEKALADKSQENDLAKCNCGDPKRMFRPRRGADMEVQLKEELALTCPVHRERRLSGLLWADIIGSDGKRIPNPKMDPILRSTKRRYDRQSGQVPEVDAGNV
jgi:hypothetical protein